MSRLSLLTVLLTITLGVVCVGWWVEHNRQPEVYYLHLFARQWVVPGFDVYHPQAGSQSQSNERPVRLATIAISPDRPIWANLPNDYNPTIHLVEGQLRNQQGTLRGRLEFSLEAPDAAVRSEHASTFALDKSYVLQYDDRFFFVISRSQDPYTLQAIQKMLAAPKGQVAP